MNDTERYLFLALIEAVEDIELLFHSIAHRHQALLIVLRDKGIITSRQYEDAVKERQAAGAVELALDQEWTRKKAVGRRVRPGCLGGGSGARSGQAGGKQRARATAQAARRHMGRASRAQTVS